MTSSSKAQRLHARDESSSPEPEYKPRHGTRIKKPRKNPFHIEGYLDSTEPLPNGLDHHTIITKYPNHLRGEVLYKIAEFYSGSEIASMCPADEINTDMMCKRIEYARKTFNPNFMTATKKRKLAKEEKAKDKKKASAGTRKVKKAGDGSSATKAIAIDEDSDDEVAVPALQPNYRESPASDWFSTTSQGSYPSSRQFSQAPLSTSSNSVYSPSPPAPASAYPPAGPHASAHNAQAPGPYSAAHDHLLNYQTVLLNEVQNEEPDYDAKYRMHSSKWGRRPDRELQLITNAEGRINTRDTEAAMIAHGYDPELYREIMVMTDEVQWIRQWVLI